MKKQIIILLLFLFNYSFAQTDGMSYQAIILNPNLELPGINDSNNILPNKPLKIRFSIISSSDQIEYQEIHQTQTDEYGMINLIIGSGTSTVGIYTNIFWDGTPKDLKVEYNLGGSFELLSLQPLLFTPYAYHRDIIANGNLSVSGNTLFTGNLTVNGTTNLNNSLSVNNGSPTQLSGILNVVGASTFNNSLTVANASPALFTGNLTVNGTTNLNNSLSVNNGSPTQLSGILNVDGASTFNNSLTVANASPALLTGNLTVNGTTNLNNSLSVNNGSPTQLSGTLNVDGASTFNNSLTVANASPALLTGNLTVNGITTLNEKLNANGQVTIHANFPLDEENYDNYPLRVEGSGQGIAIKLNSDSPNNSNNFITFYDNNGSAIGRIEGETTSEVASDPEYIYTNAMLVANEVKAGVNVGLSAIPVVTGGVIVSTGPCGACIAMAAADLVLASAELAAYNVFAFENLGVTYQSGSADFAEWILRENPNELILPGDIISVNSGKISKNTINSQQLLVISTKPTVLGNMPNEKEQYLYNKVAFMGQIPVKVKGIVFPGDYIIPSGKNDGIGVAISPNSLLPKHYKEIVGVAWSSALIESNDYSLINMSIGINSNLVAQLIEQHDKKIEGLENRLKAIEEGKTIAQNQTIQSQKQNSEINKDYKFEKALNILPETLTDEIIEDAFEYLKNAYQERGVVVSKYPALNRLLNDVVYKQEIVEKTKKRYAENYEKMKLKMQN